MSALATEQKSQNITYPISPEYCKGWTAERGLAELVANALDEDAAPKVEWADSVFTISDTGAGIPEYGLILGRTEKGNGSIGQYGEGKKIAALVLARTRNIKGLTIETVGYTIEPSIVREAILPGSSERHEMLSYKVTTNDRTSGTVITVEGVKEDLAAKVKARFRSLNEPGYVTPSEASTGELLIGSPGKVYIGGVLVQERKELKFGYDLSLSGHKSLQNRDRTVIDGSALKHSIRRIVEKIECPDALEKIIRAALDGSLDTAERCFPHSPSPGYRKALTEVQKRIYGEKKLAYRDYASNDEQTLDLRDRGWLIPEAKIDAHQHLKLMQLLGAKAVSQIARNAAKQPKQVTAWIKDAELTEEERDVLATAVTIVRAMHGADSVGEVQAYSETRYEKADEELHFGGFYQPTGKGKIGLHRNNLHSLQVTLEVLIHEAAHRILHRNGTYNYQDRTREFERQLGDMAAVMAMKLHALGAIEQAAVESEQAATAKETAAENVPGLAARKLARAQMSVAGLKTVKAFAVEAGLSQGMAATLVATGGKARLSIPPYEQVEAGCEALGLDAPTIWLSLFSHAICTYSRNDSGKLYGGGHWSGAKSALDILRARSERDAELAEQIEQQLSGTVTTDVDGEQPVYRWQARPKGTESWLAPYQELLASEMARLAKVTA